MSDQPVLVVGAGPTGMAMAIELKRFGLPVRLIDKSTHLAEHSQALVIQARTMEQFQRYGLASRMVTQGRKLTRATFSSDSKVLLSFSFDSIASQYPYLLFLPQSETERILNEFMNSLGVFAERGTELVTFANLPHGGTAKLRHGDGREEKLDVRWLIGCDGAHSTVRDLVGIPFEGESAALSFFLGDLEIEGPDVPGDELSLHLHQGDVVFMGRLSDKWTRVIVALHADQGKAAQKKTLSVEDFQKALKTANLKATVKSAVWMTPFYVNDRQARHYRSDNAFIAGDASHIHSPVGGQGMNTGIQDVANLAWKLAAVARGADQKLLDSYEEERGEVGKALLRFTSRGLKMATLSNPILEAARDALLPILTKFPRTQKAIVGFISETAIAYRGSSIVADAGGDGSLRAGDRMPDLEISCNGTVTHLLQDWTQPTHLVIVLAGTQFKNDGTLERLGNAKVVSVDPSSLTEEGRHILGKDEKIVILRPDGYVGFRGTPDHHEQLAAYAQKYIA